MVSGKPQVAHSLIAALVAAGRSAVGGALVALVIAVGLGAAQAQEEAGLPLPDGASLAVLPFVNMSTERDLQYLSDGVTEDIIRNLGVVGSLFVIASDSSFRFVRIPLPDVGRQLGVQNILKGRVGRVG